MSTALDLRQIPITLLGKLPGLVCHEFRLSGLIFVVCIVDRPVWWPFGPKARLVVYRVGGAL